jgi:cyclin C
LAGLNVPIPRVATIIQELISLYTLWSRFKEESIPDSAHHLSGARKKDKGKEKGKGRPLNVDTSGEITTSTMTQLTIHMREQKEADMAHPPSTGRAVAINKVIERAQIAG